MTNARVVAYFYCSRFETVASQPTHIGTVGQGFSIVPIDILINLTPPFMPSAFSFGFGIGISGLDLRKENLIRYEFASPSNNTLLEQIIPLRIEESHLAGFDDDMPGCYAQIALHNIALEEEGYYTSKVYVNDHLVGEFPIKSKAVRFHADSAV